MMSMFRFGRISALAGVLVLIGLAAASPNASADDAPHIALAAVENEEPATLHERIRQQHGLAHVELQELTVRTLARGMVRIQFQLDGAAAEMALHPHSVRSDDFAVYTVGADGRPQRQVAPPSRTYRGSLTGHPDSKVAATIVDGAIRAFIEHDDELWAVQPVELQVVRDRGALHAVYRRTDIIPGDWTCGTDNQPAGPLPQPAAGRGVASTSCISVAELAMDVDAEYYFANNSSTDDVTADVESILNAVNLIYGFQVGIEHLLTELVIHTDLINDPYTSNGSGQLLEQFRSYRITNPYVEPFDVAHLFTGKELIGSVIGVAWLSGICDTDFQYGLSQSQFTTNFLNRVILTAHELGHNWSARHCDGDEDCGIMCSAVASCSGVDDEFSQRSSESITSFRDAVGCLGDGAASFAANGRLLAAESQPNASFGIAVDIDGSTAVTGAYLEDFKGTANLGAAYVYDFNGSEWNQTQKLQPLDLDANDRFGVDVAIDNNDDVRTIVVGAYLDSGKQISSGSAYVFREFGGTWVQLQKLIKPEKMVGDQFGLSVDISGDYIIIGAPRDPFKGSDAGAAYVFKYDGSSYVFESMLTAGPKFGDPNDRFGTSVSISSVPTHGTVAVVGAWQDDESASNAGAAYVFRFVPAPKEGKLGEWQMEQKLCPALIGDQFGYSVSIDKNTLAVGAWLDNEIEVNGGSVYMYTYDPDSMMWLAPQKITEAVMPDDNFGSSVAVEDDVLVVGAYLDDVVGTDAGVVYTYRQSQGTWISVGRVEPVDLAEGDQLGLNVGVSGDLGIGGAWRHDDMDDNQGAAWIFLINPSPVDCDGSGIPDHCEIESGVLPDCNGNDVPDMCDIAEGDSLDDDLNGIPDECDFDCNANGTTDSTEIELGLVPDCNGNGIPDSCDIDPADPDGNGMVSTDINGDLVPDECTPDCNGNGIPDSTDIAGGTSLDCNGNGIPDECDRMDFIAETGQLGPVGPASPQQVILDAGTTSLPWAVGDVTIRVTANADLDRPGENVSMYIDGELAYELFTSGATQCPLNSGQALDVETRFLPADIWNAALRRDAEIILDFEASATVTANQCSPGSWLQVFITYESGDCNDNDILDECEIAAMTVSDCNANGVPDDCELLLFDCNNNGVPDDCELPPTDINDDGIVNLLDLLDLIDAWGPCPGCPEDVNGDNVVNLFDLLDVIDTWNTCP